VSVSVVVYDPSSKWGRGSSFKMIVHVINGGVSHLLREDLYEAFYLGASSI